MSTERTGIYDIGQEPDDSDILRLVARQTQVETRTNTIGKVLSFDPVSCTATIEFQIPKISKDPANPLRDIVSAPYVSARVPVVFPRSQAGAILTWPILPGQTGEVFVQDRDPSKWLQSGVVTDPISRATHWLAFGAFHPGLATNSTTQQQGPVDLTATVLDGENLVKLGKNAALGVGRLGDTVAADTGMLAWIVQVQAALTTISGIIPLALPAPPTDFGLISGASTKVLAE